MQDLRALSVLLFVSILHITSTAQMCPGGGTDFNSAVTFDPAWIYGCNTGTSCNGGVNFDNRASCQPTTSLDACAPAPTCGAPADDASNIWFKFYAASSTVTLSGFQNTSFVIGIQAFTGGSVCGTLVQLGCALAGGPSSGVSLTLTGLAVGELYYYRIFGSANNFSQRTGIYCFCGTTGIQTYVLPAELVSFTGSNRQDKVNLNWSFSSSIEEAYYQLQASKDGIVFTDITQGYITESVKDVSFSYRPPVTGKWLYRLKINDSRGDISYSPVITLYTRSAFDGWDVKTTENKTVNINASSPATLLMYDIQGRLMKSLPVPPGSNRFVFPELDRGIYILRESINSAARKLVLY